MRFRAVGVAAWLLAAVSATGVGGAQAKSNGVSGQAVLKLTQEYVDAAPKRYVGSEGHMAAEKFIKDHFKPEAAKGDFVVDEFVARSTPAGPFTMRNLIVKFPSAGPAKKDGVIVLASHYETNFPLKDINFVGANDGACTSALLIALGQYYREHPPTGYSVWLVFTDGEEAIANWSASDSLYGTRHLAAKWSGDGTLPKIKAFILADMIGWKQMKIDRENNSTPWLEDLLTKAAKDTGHLNYISSQGQAIEDDHLPFKQRGVPVLDVIDYEYGTPSNPEAYHHTVQDTMGKLSAQSLQVSADLFLDLVKLINAH
jgi:glutaminyl-peptide cyclotransferase